MYVTAERFQQPPAGTPAAGEWLKRGLVFASTLADPRSVDAVTQRVSVYADFPPVYATQFGAGRVFGLTSTAYQQTPYTGGVRQTNKKSYVIRANPFGTGGGTFGRLFDKGDGTTLETRAWWDGTTITYSQAFDGAVGVWTVPWTTARVPFVLAVSHDQTLDSNVPIIMVNGVRLPVTTATPASGTRQVTAEPMIVGNRASDQLRNFDGWLADFLIFDSALTEGELRGLSFNPYQAWEPETLAVPLPVGVAIPLTGAADNVATMAGTMNQGANLSGAADNVATAAGTMTQAQGLTGAAADVATMAGTLNAGAIAIQDGYDRASVNLAASSVSGTGNSAVITIRPKMQYSEVAGFAGQAFIANEYKAQHDELGRVIPVTPLYAFEVNDTTLMPASGRKRIGVVISGLHAGEDHAQFVVQQFVAALLGNTPDALAMRREFRVIFLPLVNSPGRAGGGWRGVFDLGPSGEDDPNRHFNQLGVLEVVDKPRAALAYDTSGALPDWVIDMHSAGDQNFGLEYGNPMQMDFHRIVQDIMGRPVDRNAPTFNGQCSNWFQNRGVPLTVTSEVGDVSPASDDSIRSFGAGMMGGVAQLRAGAVAAPVPAPAPAPAPIPPIIRPITVTRATNPPSSKYDGSALDNMGAMTILAYVRPTGRGGGATGLSYIWSKMTANGQPRRLMVDHNGGVPRLSFGLASTSSLAQWGPNASSGPGTVAYGQWALLGATHDGRLRDSSIGLIVNAPVSTAETESGGGALSPDAGTPMVLLNREDLSRPFVGDFGGFGLWNRVLSPSEIDAVRVGGPQAVPSGLVVFEDWVPATAPIPPTPTVPVSIDLNLGSATFAGTATINADGSWDATLKARGTWR